MRPTRGPVPERPTMQALALLISAAALSLTTAAVAATADPQTAPRGVALAVVLGAVVLPAGCIIGASQEMDR
jgi:hypothetical protein